VKQFIHNNRCGFAVFLFLLMTSSLPPQWNAAVALRLGGLLALCAFAAWILNRVIGQADETRRTPLISLAALLLAGYATHPVLSLDSWYKDSFVFIGAATAALFVLSLYATGHSSMIWRIPLYCALAGAMEPLFVFTFLPAVLLALAEKKSSAKNKSGNYTAVQVLTLLISVAAFLIFSRRASKRAGEQAYFSIASDGWRLPALSVAVLLPAIILAAALWASALRAKKTKTAATVPVLAMLAPLISAVSLFVQDIHINFVASAVFSQLCLLLYFSYTGNQQVHSALESMEAFFKKNRLLFYVILIYLAAFSSTAKIGEWRYFWF